MCRRNVCLFLKQLSFNCLLKVALALLQKCILSLLPSPWKVITGSKLLSLRSCRKVQNVLIRKLTPSHTNLAIVDGARMWGYYFMHNDMRPENMWTGSQTRESWGASSFPESTEMKQNSAMFWTQVSGGQNSCTPALFKHCIGEYSGSGSTQPGLSHYAGKPPKIVKL